MNDRKNGKYEASGVVVLCICVLNKQRSNTGWAWGKKHHSMISQSKSNLMGGSASHFGSEGKYYSYGNKGNYGMIGTSSVGQYANRKYKDRLKMDKSIINASVIEEMASKELGAGIDGVARIIPNIRKLIAHVINVANKVQDRDEDINLHKTPSFKDGLWQSSISVNGRTNEFHTENDSTYTVIAIPKQEEFSKRKHEYSFIFKLKEKHNISIRLTEGTSFLYSGKLLTHRQSCNLPIQMKDEVFINFASYGTQRLFSHIKKTMMRNNI